MSKIPSVKRKLLKRVAERDKWICQICGDPVDPNGAGINAPTLDHVVPRSKGGLRVFGNLRLAHYHCNWERGHRDASLTLVLCHCIVISGGVLDVKKTCPVHGAREADRGG